MILLFLWSFDIHAPLQQADSTDLTAPTSLISHLISSDLICSTTEACLVHVPEKGRSSEFNDFKPLALIMHVMKTLECLLLHLLRP